MNCKDYDVEINDYLINHDFDDYQEEPDNENNTETDVQFE